MKLTRHKKLFLSTMAMTVAVSATGVSLPAPVEAAKPIVFKDVPEKHYAHEAVTYMAANGIIKGYADNTYRLNKPVTRAQAAKMIAMAIDAKPSHAYKIDFKDVKKDNGSYDHIRALTQRGLFMNQEKFNPNKSLTRGQMAKLLVLGYHIVTDDNDFIIFDDVKEKMEAYKYIITIAELNITTTRPGGEFKPNAPVTRGQLAAFLFRTMDFDDKRKKGLIKYDMKKQGYVDQDENLIKPNPDNEKPKPDKPKPVPPKPKPEPPKPVPPKPTPTYGTIEETFKKFDYKWLEYGESRASGFNDSLVLTNAWMSSPEHRENLLSPKFTHMGAGTAPDKDGKIYWVILFSKK